MKIEHIAIWVKDLEHMRDFYANYFGMQYGEMYVNEKKGFSSYFMSLGEGARLELMHRHEVERAGGRPEFAQGFTHLAFSTGSRFRVDELTERLRNDGYKIAGEPRVTGDGYYESVIEDPEGNHVEVTE